MVDDICFETPENVQISYRNAGPGTRFVAWFMDNILISIMAFVVFLATLFAGASADILGQDRYGRSSHAFLYLVGLFYIAYSFGSLLYFGCCELLMHGQTIGKRSVHIRVVKADGFSVDPLSIGLRTIFRLIDHLPPLYIVPLMTANGRRLGDLIAGTVVVVDEKAELGTVRDQLIAQQMTEAVFRFDVTTLKRSRPEDVQAVERILERWSKLAAAEQELLLGRIVPSLAARLQVDCPLASDWFTFLRDFLAAVYRRQHRKLG